MHTGPMAAQLGDLIAHRRGDQTTPASRSKRTEHAALLVSGRQRDPGVNGTARLTTIRSRTSNVAGNRGLLDTAVRHGRRACR